MSVINVGAYIAQRMNSLAALGWTVVYVDANLYCLSIISGVEWDFWGWNGTSGIGWNGTSGVGRNSPSGGEMVLLGAEWYFWGWVEWYFLGWDSTSGGEMVLLGVEWYFWGWVEWYFWR